MSVAGRTYHVLSRIGPAGLDYTERTNKLAHHVVLGTNELPPGGPAWLLQQPTLMRSSWDGRVGWLPAPPTIPGGNRKASVCRAWGELTGDPGWAGVLAESFAGGEGQPVYLLFKPGTDVLTLLAEALALLPEAERWAVTFSSYCVSLPQGIACAWRCLPAGTPEAKQVANATRGLILNLASGMPSAPTGALTELARTGQSIERAASFPQALSLDPAQPLADSPIPDAVLLPTRHDHVKADQFSTPITPSHHWQVPGGPPPLPGMRPTDSDRSRKVVLVVAVAAASVIVAISGLFYLRPRLSPGGSELALAEAQTATRWPGQPTEQRPSAGGAVNHAGTRLPKGDSDSKATRPQPGSGTSKAHEVQKKNKPGSDDGQPHPGQTAQSLPQGDGSHSSREDAKPAIKPGDLERAVTVFSSKNLAYVDLPKWIPSKREDIQEVEIGRLPHAGAASLSLEGFPANLISARSDHSDHSFITIKPDSNVVDDIAKFRLTENGLLCFAWLPNAQNGDKQADDLQKNRDAALKQMSWCVLIVKYTKDNSSYYYGLRKPRNIPPPQLAMSKKFSDKSKRTFKAKLKADSGRELDLPPPRLGWQVYPSFARTSWPGHLQPGEIKAHKEPRDVHDPGFKLALNSELDAVSTMGDEGKQLIMRPTAVYLWLAERSLFAQFKLELWGEGLSAKRVAAPTDLVIQSLVISMKAIDTEKKIPEIVLYRTQKNGPGS